ncbi:MAG: 50S ribosomal protein L25/general stress protein Ctc [Deltaproteobacteria bacterium]|nr:MAG: 50S ribosomal protein L25/general stress protein Ctc [Deltaproteobacteria bacterium]
MEQIILKASVRESTGKGPARTLRRENKMPAVLYGPNKESMLLSVDIKELEQISKKYNLNHVLLNLVIEDGKTVKKQVMVKELQAHPVSMNFLHVDFYEIAMDRKIKVNIPVVAKGKSKGVELGGVLQIVRRELEVLCLPAEIPDTIEIDITDLGVGDSVHVEEIPLEGDIEIPAEVNFTVLTILSPKIEAIEVEEEEEEAEAEVEEEVEEEGAPEATEED